MFVKKFFNTVSPCTHRVKKCYKIKPHCANPYKIFQEKMHCSNFLVQTDFLFYFIKIQTIQIRAVYMDLLYMCNANFL